MDWRYNTIWFDQIEAEKVLKWDIKETKVIPNNIADIEYLILWHYKHKGNSFDRLPSLDKLLYLELNFANILDFNGIGKLPNLKKLEMHYCTKLESDVGTFELANTIEYLYIHHSKKLSSVSEITKLSKLKGLRLIACGPLENIKFIRELPNLIDFRFVDTNVLDGDLTPLIEHPTLRSAGFLNKRHYNYTVEKMNLILNAKFNDEYLDYAYKGEYRTFKHREHFS
jgi:hypothetical protein